LNLSPNTKIKKLSLFDIVNTIGIGVNVEGKALASPSMFSTAIDTNIYLLMEMKPNYKLPSFRLGFMEVVTVAASAVTASLVKSFVSVCSFKKKFLLMPAFNSIAPGWINTFNACT